MIIEKWLVLHVTNTAFSVYAYCFLWKTFTSIKDDLRAKLDKIFCANLFNSTILLAMLYAIKTWATIEKKEK